MLLQNYYSSCPAEQDMLCPVGCQGMAIVITSSTHISHQGKNMTQTPAYPCSHQSSQPNQPNSIALPSSLPPAGIIPPSARPKCFRNTVEPPPSICSPRKGKSTLDHTLLPLASNKISKSGVAATSSRNARNSSAASSSKSAVVQIGTSRWNEVHALKDGCSAGIMQRVWRVGDRGQRDGRMERRGC